MQGRVGEPVHAGEDGLLLADPVLDAGALEVLEDPLLEAGGILVVGLARVEGLGRDGLVGLEGLNGERTCNPETSFVLGGLVVHDFSVRLLAVCD